jgi:hypothetical protein
MMTLTFPEIVTSKITTNIYLQVITIYDSNKTTISPVSFIMP